MKYFDYMKSNLLMNSILANVI